MVGYRTAISGITGHEIDLTNRRRRDYVDITPISYRIIDTIRLVKAAIKGDTRTANVHETVRISYARINVIRALKIRISYAKIIKISLKISEFIPLT